MGGDSAEPGFVETVGIAALVGAGGSIVQFTWNTAPGMRLGTYTYPQILAKTGKNSAILAFVAGLYMTGKTLAAGIRSTDDSFNNGFGGALVGAFTGLKSGKIHGPVLHSIMFGVGATALTFITKELNNGQAHTHDKKKFSYVA